eukprot:TRINITY_DN27303_c0_g1_i1.p1 TRINITY_DN27303_c0_g1~~TRINITY_DN27303_c0_g1_i1.p1  ORF type:complete len:961 (+),score=424.34 TRINITY_DN27303_c0_g1_i1:54-2936(+)
MLRQADKASALLRRFAQQTRHATNGVVAIRREDKNEWERRVPLTPAHVRLLVHSGLRVLVQPSSIRAFTDDEYVEAGAEIREDLSEADTICAVKEVPIPKLLADKTYMMFSHTHKAQPYNMPMLDTILQKNIRLIDFERISGSEGRLVKFGPFAGFAGTIDTLHALGLALLAKNFATPFLYISHAKEYRSLQAAREDLIQIGDLIRTRGLPREAGPLTFVITGTGSVSQAAQQILHHLPCQYIDASELKSLCEKKEFDNKTIYVTVARARDMVQPKDPKQHFNKDEYYKNPEQYKACFHKSVAPYAKVIINGMYWEEKYPRLLTVPQVQELHKEDRFPLLAVGEITCDPHGSLEFFTKSTSIAHPKYVYDPRSDKAVDWEDFRGQGPIIVGVDHLPAEFPKESSEYFGGPLVDLVKHVAQSDRDDPWEKQAEALPASLANATIACHGKLTPNYEYINSLRKQRTDMKEARENRNVLFLGAGMVSGPAVKYLLRDSKNSITLADVDVKAAEAVLEEWAGDAYHSGRDVEGKTQSARAISLDVSDKAYLTSLVRDADVVISLVPWTMHPMVMDICIENKIPCCTASYVSPGVAALHEKAEAAGVTILNEMGVDPGIDIMSSFQLLERVKADGGVVRSYESFCGALPEPEHANNCLGYKFSWSPKGVMLAAQRPCTFLWNNTEVDIEGRRLYDVALPFTPFKALKMEWVPNGNAINYKDVYGLHDAHTIVRSTLRFGGFSAVIKSMRELGILDADAVLEGLKEGKMSWPQVLAERSGVAVEDFPAHLVKKLTAVRASIAEDGPMSKFYDGSNDAPVEEEVKEALAGMQELGLLDESSEVPNNAGGFIIDSLSTHLAKTLALESHENDFVMMYHRVIADMPDGSVKQYEAKMTERGLPGSSATANTVGLPVAIGAQLVLNGEIAKSGIVRPITPEVYNPVMRELAQLGIRLRESVQDVPKASSA